MFRLEENLNLSNVMIRKKSNFDDKYFEKSLQLVRGSSFWNDLLQNPYFSHPHKHMFQGFLVISCIPTYVVSALSNNRVPPP